MVGDIILIDPYLSVVRRELLLVLSHLELILLIKRIVLLVQGLLGQVNFPIQLDRFICELATLSP